MRINGQEVKDSAKKLRIEVTPRDVKLGATKDAAACAAARALCRQTGCSEARVHIGRTYLKMDDKWVRYETPASLRAEIIAFDRGGHFEPGEHILRAVRPSHRDTRGKRQGSSAKGRPRGQQKARPKHVVTGIRHNGANR